MDQIENYPRVDLSQLSQITHSYHRSESGIPQSTRALIIRFSGSYDQGGKGNSDADYMIAVIAAGIEGWHPNALVFDMRELRYSWGDRLQNVVGIGRQKLNTLEEILIGKETELKTKDIPTAVVVSDLCRKGLEGLVREEMKSDPQFWLFDNLAEALKAVQSPNDVRS